MTFILRRWKIAKLHILPKCFGLDQNKTYLVTLWLSDGFLHMKTQQNAHMLGFIPIYINLPEWLRFSMVNNSNIQHLFQFLEFDYWTVKETMAGTRTHTWPFSPALFGCLPLLFSLSLLDDCVLLINALPWIALLCNPDLSEGKGFVIRGLWILLPAYSLKYTHTYTHTHTHTHTHTLSLSLNSRNVTWSWHKD